MENQRGGSDDGGGTDVNGMVKCRYCGVEEREEVYLHLHYISDHWREYHEDGVWGEEGVGMMGRLEEQLLMESREVEEMKERVRVLRERRRRLRGGCDGDDDDGGGR